METQASIMLGRPAGIPADDVDTEFPSDGGETQDSSSGIEHLSTGSPESSTTNLKRAIHTFRVRHLLSQIHSFVYSKSPACCFSKERHDRHIQHLRNKLEAWKSSIPAITCTTDPPMSLFGTSDWFALEYDYAILQLYRVKMVDPQADPGDPVFLECMGAAERICHHYRRQFPGGPASFTWVALHELFLAGLTYVHCLWASPAVRNAQRHGQVRDTCTNCTIVLVVMAERWSAVAPYRDLFEILANRTIRLIETDEHDQMDPIDIPTITGGQENEEAENWAHCMLPVFEAGMSNGYNDLLSRWTVDFALSN
ncbi:hypothetical protein PFICI_03377 [Pestalotiopsis fici W106-1]|uniref:Xylanolytic transcriptional activator regulatory domain-containing protein n=1 Tax=Pestalotiopsis fici (strain W106-1 / CGMCC3.15140) TaxID=1229662 RepID=W3XIU3_PESFW|nr:uncharacterized protein PFICI_03377 [Pestalotiopsis fici W106-1]ETS85352.1 hypothetical protein PFICI_03377 [Pestalotiopsis fici W106-1]